MVITVRNILFTASQRFYLLISLLFCGGAVLFLFDTPFSPSGPHTLCLFRNLTGIPCPGCGMGRGIDHLLHLQFGEAIFMNPLCILVFPAIILTVSWMVRDFFSGDESLFRFYLKSDKYFSSHKAAMAVLFIMIAGTWLWNIFK